jgi:DNA topoisomerase-1
MEALTAEAEDARSARLRYVDDTMPGFRRERTRSGFAFFDQHGKLIEDEAELGRIRALAIPPAYEHVWICPVPNGHVQATARDARGRKQYRYHKRWREVRDANKFESTIAFARALPALRARVADDLAKGGTSRSTVLASVVTMLEATLVRVGNETYVRENGSYGLTTLRSRHVRIEGEKRIRLRFRGKSGVEHAVTIEDKRLARTIRRCRDLPGESLFRYVDDAGETHEVTSDDVNAYLREATSGDFSAKDFRTWSATVICALALDAAGPAETVAEAKRNVAAALAATAARLGNTPTVCRTSYVHPSVLEAYLDDRKLALPRARATAKARGLEADERRVLAFLERSRDRDVRGRNLALLETSVRQAKRRRSAA